MDKYCIKILEIIVEYERENSIGIGMSVLDRKFYREFNLSDAYLTEKVSQLKQDGYLKDERPYSLTNKGKEYLATHNEMNI